MRSRLSVINSNVAPLSAALITAAVILIPAERSGWDVSGTASQFVFFLTTVLIYSVFCIGLNVQWGYTGIFNFGVAAFFLVGSYTAAVFAKGDPPAPDPVTGQDYVQYIGGFGDDLNLFPALGTDEWLPFIVAVLMAALVAGILAFLIAIPALRLRGDYLAITTIGIAELLRAIVVEEPSLFNSSKGLPSIPSPLSGLFTPSEYDYVYVGLLIVLVGLLFLLVERGIRSPWGRVLRAVREDEQVTSASGKNPFEFKTQAFVFGAMIMGIGGAVYGFDRHSLSPETFAPISTTFLFWTMVMVGGSGNTKGSILGAYVVYGFYFVMIQVQGYDLPGWINTTRVSALRDTAIGLLIVLVLLWRPHGLLPEEARVSMWVERRLRRGGRGASTPPPGPAAETPET